MCKVLAGRRFRNSLVMEVKCLPDGLSCLQSEDYAVKNKTWQHEPPQLKTFLFDKLITCLFFTFISHSFWVSYIIWSWWLATTLKIHQIKILKTLKWKQETTQKIKTRQMLKRGPKQLCSFLLRLLLIKHIPIIFRSLWFCLIFLFHAQARDNNSRWSLLKRE